jgi:hypothetical protein
MFVGMCVTLLKFTVALFYTRDAKPLSFVGSHRQIFFACGVYKEGLIQ